MKNVAAITGSITILLAASLTQPPSAEAQFKGVNEIKWAKSIQADVNNGAPADAICSNASNSAMVSDEAEFKNWAYGIARKYCSEGYEKSPSSPSPVALSDNHCSVTHSDLYRLQQDKFIKITGLNCYLFIKKN